MIFFLMLFMAAFLLYFLILGVKIYFYLKVVQFKKCSIQSSLLALKQKGRFNGVLASRMEEEPFKVSIGKNRSLSGCFVRSSSSHLAVFLPGFSQTRYDMMERAEFFFAQGWNLLFFDFRHSGDSDGLCRSLGGVELRDFGKVMEWGYRRLPSADKVYLVGVSLGAAVASIYAPKDHRIDGLILDSLYPSATKLIGHWLKPLPFPKWILDRILLSIIGWVRYFPRYSLSDINPEYSLMRTPIPVLFIHGDEDFCIPPSSVYELFEKRRGIAPSRLYFCKGATSHNVVEQDPLRYQKMINDFLEEDFHLKEFSKLL